MMVSSEIKARLKWQCRRGMLEIDILLNRFLNKHLNELNSKQLVAFEKLLSYPDPDIYQWLIGQSVPGDEEIIDIVTYIQFHNQNKTI